MLKLHCYDTYSKPLTKLKHGRIKRAYATAAVEAVDRAKQRSNQRSIKVKGKAPPLLYTGTNVCVCVCACECVRGLVRGGQFFPPLGGPGIFFTHSVGVYFLCILDGHTYPTWFT